MYVIYKGDGSIRYKQLNTFIQQGNEYVDELFVAIEGYSPSDYTLNLIPTLPDGTTATALIGNPASLEVGGTTYYGSKFTFSPSITAESGLLVINITATDLQAHTLVTYSLTITINKTGIQVNDPVYLSYAEWQQLISGLGQYELKYDIHNLRKYESLALAQADTSLIDKQMFAVVDNSNGVTFYKHYIVSGSHYYIACTLNGYALDSAVVHKGGDENIADRKTFTSYLPRVYGTAGIPSFSQVDGSELTPKAYVDEEIAKIKARTDVVDVVGTYADLLAYDTSKLSDNDIVKVLSDITHNNAESYYRWVITGGVGDWNYVGSGDFYTKAQTDSLLAQKSKVVGTATNDKWTKLEIDGVEKEIAGGGGGTSDYTQLTNKPKINSVELNGNKTSSDLGLQASLGYTAENQANKVTSIDNTSTDTQYPSAKCVWDNVENVREIAEGKCKSWVLSYAQTIASVKSEIGVVPSEKVYDLETGADITQDVLDGDYDNSLVANANFNSQDNEISTTVAPTYDYGLLILQGDGGNFYFAQYNSTLAGLYPFKMGDIILVSQTEVPDRWYAGNTNWDKLETSKVDLTNYYTKTQTDAKFTTSNGNIAENYDSSATYTSGDYAIDNGVLKKYDGSTWSAVKVTDELGDSGTLVEPIDYDRANTQLTGLKIGDTNYRLLQSGFIRYSSGVSLGYQAEAQQSGSVAIGNAAISVAENSIAIGNQAVNQIENAITFDKLYNGGQRTQHFYKPSCIFFRNYQNEMDYTTFSDYTTGYTLDEVLNGLTLTDNSVTQIPCNKTLKQTLGSNVTYTFETAPTNTGVNLSCKPEYKLIITTTAQITITLPTGTYNLQTNDSSVSISSNVITITNTGTYKLVIQQVNSDYLIKINNPSLPITPTCLPLSGGTMTGSIKFSNYIGIINEYNRDLIYYVRNYETVFIGNFDDKIYLRNDTYIYGNFIPDYNNSNSLGNSTKKWKDLYLAGNLTDGTNSIAVSNIASTSSLSSYLPLSGGTMTGQLTINSSTYPQLSLYNGSLTLKGQIGNGYINSNNSMTLTAGSGYGVSIVGPTGVDLSTTSGGGASSIQLKFWKGTQAQYDAISTKDSNTFYIIVG